MKCQHKKLEATAYDLDCKAFEASQNREHELLVDLEKQIWDLKENGCTECGKSCIDMAMDPNDFDPTTKPSQQVRGENTMYCNSCQMYVKPTTWQGEEVCPYHQRVHNGEEGPEFMYEEFNQDGEEW
jgi:hypothetical protein